MFKADSFFSIGSSHDICQDYAHAQILTPFHAVAIVCDGCSMISTDNTAVPHPHSDIDSRMACVSMLDALTSEPKYRAQRYACFLDRIRRIQENIGIEGCDSTCIGLVWTSDGPNVIWIGDGAVLIETDSEYIIKYRTFNPNMPIYTSYVMKYYRGKRYIESGIEMTDHTIMCDKTWDTISTENKVTKLKDIESTIFVDPSWWSDKPLKSISIFSDGIEDVLTSGHERLSIKEAIQTMTSFKNTGGLFVRRRMKAQIKRWAREGMSPNDDLSMATIIHNV